MVRCVHQLCSSVTFQQVMAYTWRAGHVLNHGPDAAASAAAAGFTICSLAKLSQTKGFVPNVTFLQFVVQSLEVCSVMCVLLLLLFIMSY